jgi:hypothetical protein
MSLSKCVVVIKAIIRLASVNTRPLTQMIELRPLRRVALVRTDVSDERIAAIIRVTRIDVLGKLAVTGN